MTDKTDLQADTEAIIPADKSIWPSKTIAVGQRQYRLETFCLYKVQQLTELLHTAGESSSVMQLLSDIVNVQSEQGSLTGGDLMNLVSQYLLPILREAPDLALRFAALAVTPNAKLQELYTGGPGAIAEHIEGEMAYLRFNADLGAIGELIIESIPFIGVDRLLGKVPNDVREGLQSALQTLGG